MAMAVATCVTIRRKLSKIGPSITASASAHQYSDGLIMSLSEHLRSRRGRLSAAGRRRPPTPGATTWITADTCKLLTEGSTALTRLGGQNANRSRPERCALIPSRA
jgi:hypothetical protein